MVRFSPLRDRQLPACQMIWLGGGYPELHAAGLSANHEMLTQLRAAHRRGVAIYAECGGLMYRARPSKSPAASATRWRILFPDTAEWGRV